MAMNNQLLVFELDNKYFALFLNIVERVIHAVEITPLPGSPQTVSGVINLEGKIIPVFNIRRRFLFTEKEINPSDKIIIAQTKKRTVAVLVDSVNELIEISENEITQSEKVLPELNYIEGIVKLKEGLILINNLDKFLSLNEEEILNKVFDQ